MNRRQFFKRLAATTALTAGGIALIEPEKTIFLPPRGGWFATPLRMREVQQYLINTDSLATRYDVGMVLNGEYRQWYVLQDTWEPDEAIRNWYRENARQALDDMIRRDGFARGKTVELALPRGLAHAVYV